MIYYERVLITRQARTFDSMFKVFVGLVTQGIIGIRYGNNVKRTPAKVFSPFDTLNSTPNHETGLAYLWLS